MNAQQVWLVYFDGSIDLSRIPNITPDWVIPNLPLSGSTSVTIPASYPYDSVRFMLIMDQFDTREWGPRSSFVVSLDQDGSAE